MGRIYAKNITTKSDIKEGQKLICKVKDKDEQTKLISHTPIFEADSYFDPTKNGYTMEEINIGDYIIYEYEGGSVVQFVTVEKA